MLVGLLIKQRDIAIAEASFGVSDMGPKGRNEILEFVRPPRLLPRCMSIIYRKPFACSRGLAEGLGFGA